MIDLLAYYLSLEKGMVLNPYITWAIDSGELKRKGLKELIYQ